MKFLSIILLLFSLVAFQPKPIIINPVAPRASVVHEVNSNTSRIATKVKTNSEKLVKEVISLDEEAKRGKTLAALMKESKKPTPEQLEENNKIWESVSFKTQFLRAATQSLKIDSSELESSALYGKQESGKLVVEAVASDKIVINLKDENAAQAGNAALGKIVKGLIWTFAITLAVLVVVGVILFILSKIPRV